MNRKGNKNNLYAAHFGNKNAAVAGVFSKGMLDERARVLKEELASRPLREVVSDLRITQLAKDLALHDALVEDIAKKGIANRKHEVRRQTELLVSVSRRVERWIHLVEKDYLSGGQVGETVGDPPSSPEDRQKIEYDLLRRWAYAEVLEIPPAEQIWAIEELFKRPPPPQPSPWALLSHEQFERLDELGDDCDLERVLPELGVDMAAFRALAEESSKWESREDVRRRCVEKLHEIATRDDVKRKDRINALKCAQRLDPIRPDFMREEIDKMSEEEMDRELEALRPGAETDPGPQIE